MAKSQPIYSGAVTLKPEHNQKYGATIATIKLFDSETENSKLPTMKGYIVGTLPDGTKFFYQVALWNAQKA
jgi:hypothetical protein